MKVILAIDDLRYIEVPSSISDSEEVSLPLLPWPFTTSRGYALEDLVFHTTSARVIKRESLSSLVLWVVCSLILLQPKAPHADVEPNGRTIVRLYDCIQA